MDMKDTKSEIILDESSESKLQKEKEKQEEKPKATLSEMYRYIQGYYKFLMVVGVISALIYGTPGALISLVVREVLNDVNDNLNRSYVKDVIMDQILYIGLIPIGLAPFGFIYIYAFYSIGRKVVYEYRRRYMKALLVQESEWYDERNAEEMPSNVNSELKDMEFGSGTAFGFTVLSLSLMLISFVCTFFMGTLYGCCLLIIFPLAIVVGGVYANIMISDAEATEINYSKCNTHAEETLGAVKVVKAFGQEPKEVIEYNDRLDSGHQSSTTQAIKKGFGVGCLESLIYLSAAIGYSVGGILVNEEVNNYNADREYRIGDIFGCYLCLLSSIYSISVCASNVALITNGLSATKSINDIIDREPKIKIDDSEAEPVGEITGSIRFDNVTFTYKTRDEQVLKGVTLEFEKGKMTALAGSSGSGKSTVAKLLERFYDPDSGTVYVNNKDLKQLNLREYRNKIGYVGQEPFLFNQSIKENLLNAKPDATDEEIDKALKDAMAYDFVQNLPKGIDSDVGAIGSKISGGQKQRIAIARALLRKPEILILDEATSALDKKNERSVQRAIEQIHKEYDITTVVIAHRLSTIKNANMIYVFEKGKVIEQGPHDELIENNGVYASFYNAQGRAYESIEQIMDEDEKEGEDEYVQKEQKDKYSEVSRRLSSSDGSTEDMQDNEPDELGYLEILQKLYVYTRPKYFIIICLIGVIVVGIGQVCIAILQMKILFSKSLDKSRSERDNIVLTYSLALLGMGITALIVQWITRACIAVMTQNLMHDLRAMAYDNMIHQPAAFYDKKENATGSVTGILAADMKLLSGASLENYLILMQGLVGVAAGVIVSLAYSLPIGLLSIVHVPISAFAFYYLATIQIGIPKKKAKDAANDKLVISESIVNHSTVASLACDEHISETNLSTPIGGDCWRSLVYIFVWVFLISYYFAAMLTISLTIEHGGEVDDMFVAFATGLNGILQISIATQNAPDWSKGKESANNIIRIVEAPREGTPESKIIDGDREMTEDIAKGDIKFKNVWFKYPTSNDKWVLKNFKLKIKTGQSVGLAGESGCGKSTLIQLLLRFYDPQRGSITISDIPITEFSLKSLRQHYGLVQQEPLIFNTTILNNICYGRSHATAEEVQQAAEIANAATFIDEFADKRDNYLAQLAEVDDDVRYLTLGEGYRVVCGVKGEKLSGGQKQRIAIARAIIKKPQIIMLDEATSALDEASQEVVQKALDRVMKTGTSLVVAHRLSTLSKCDRIVVIVGGVVVEDGSFNELQSKKGVFAQYIAEEFE